MKNKNNQNDEYMTISEIILSIIFFIGLFGTVYLFLLLTYNL